MAECEWSGCSRKATRQTGEMGDWLVCQGHAMLMQNNANSYSIPDVDTNGPIFMQWAVDRKKALRWLKEHPDG